MDRDEELKRFNRWAESNHYRREGKKLLSGPPWNRRAWASFPPKDLDLAWEAWQAALSINQKTTKG